VAFAKNLDGFRRVLGKVCRAIIAGSADFSAASRQHHRMASAKMIQAGLMRTALPASLHRKNWFTLKVKPNCLFH
jgi:hypothetical protein